MQCSVNSECDTATVPVICEEAKTVDQDGGSDVADIVAVSPDGSETVNANGAVSETNWMPIPTDIHGLPFGILVRPVQQCSRWQFTRLVFEIKDAYKFRIRIGDVFVTDWVIIIASAVNCFNNKLIIIITIITVLSILTIILAVF